MTTTATKTTSRKTAANIKKAERIGKALNALSVMPYQDMSGYPLPDAQRNLEGRTHYVDAYTLRFHKARINRAWMPECSTPAEGLLYAVGESLGSKPEDPRINKRVTCFDVFGTVVHQTGFFRTSDKAEKAFYAWLDTFDAVGYTVHAIRERITRLRRDADNAARRLIGR